VEVAGVTVRGARPADFDTIIAVVDDWWGRPAARDLTRLFLDHFFGTSLIAEHGGTRRLPHRLPVAFEASGHLHSLRRGGASLAPYRTGAQPVRAVL
jgi:hypothetical protein